MVSDLTFKLKTCTRCKRALPHESFGFVRHYGNNRRAYCKDCNKDFHRRRKRLKSKVIKPYLDQYETPITHLNDQNTYVLTLALSNLPFKGLAYSIREKKKLAFTLSSADSGLEFKLFDDVGNFLISINVSNIDELIPVVVNHLDFVNIRLEENELSLNSALTYIYYI